jgi:periplasmic protein CpxP/Spy
MKPEIAKVVETELKRFAAELNLSDAQKTQLKTVLENAGERMDAIREKHPDVSKPEVMEKLKEVRSSLRGRVEKFFTPEQLTKWDAGIAKAKNFLGHTVTS